MISGTIRGSSPAAGTAIEAPHPPPAGFRVPEAPDADHCLNCGAPRGGEFCSRCGQHFREERLTLRRLWWDFASRVFSLERGFFYTFGQLFIDPGGLSRRYVLGQRRRYVNPLTYFFIGATVSLVALTFVEDAIVRSFTEQFELSVTDEPNAREVYTKAFGPEPARVMSEQMMEVMKRFYSYLSLLLCIPFALFLRLFLGGGPHRYNLAETTVFTLYLVGHATLVIGLLAPLLFQGDAVLYSLVGLLGYAVYFSYAAKGFYGPGRSAAWLTLLAFGASYVVYMLFFLLAFVAYLVRTVR